MTSHFRVGSRTTMTMTMAMTMTLSLSSRPACGAHGPFPGMHRQPFRDFAGSIRLHLPSRINSPRGC